MADEASVVPSTAGPTPEPTPTSTPAPAPLTGMEAHLAALGLTTHSPADLGADTGEAESQTEGKPADSESISDQEPEAPEKKEESAPKAPDVPEAKEEKVPEEKAPEQSKPPKGYVPLAALHAERETAKRLQVENQNLKAQVYDLSRKPEEKPLVTLDEVNEFKDFKPLSKAEVAKLMEDNPAAGVEYAEKLTQYNDFALRHKDHQMVQAERAKSEEHVAAEALKVREAVATEFESIVPGILSDDAVRNDISDFAESIGFPEELFGLVDPDAVVQFGKNPPMRMGMLAAQVLKMLTGVKKSLADVKSGESDLRKSIEAEIKTKVENELLGKLKNPTDSKRPPVSVDDILVSGTNSTSKAKERLSQREIQKLNPAEQRAYYQGA